MPMVAAVAKLYIPIALESSLNGNGNGHTNGNGNANGISHGASNGNGHASNGNGTPDSKHQWPLRHTQQPQAPRAFDSAGKRCKGFLGY